MVDGISFEENSNKSQYYRQRVEERGKERADIVKKKINVEYEY